MNHPFIFLLCFSSDGFPKKKKNCQNFVCVLMCVRACVHGQRVACRACHPMSSVMKLMAESYLDDVQTLPVSSCNTLYIYLPLIRSLDLKTSTERNIPNASACNCISPKHGGWRSC